MKKIIYYEKILKDIEKKTGNKKIQIIIDILLCILKYKASIKDYVYFAMYKMSEFEKSTILTKGKNNEYIKKYNQPKQVKYINEPVEFYKNFRSFLNRDWLEIKKKRKDFKRFCLEHQKIIVIACKGRKKIDTKDKNLDKLYNKLLEEKILIVEEEIHMISMLKKIKNKEEVTIKVITLLGHVAFSFLIVGDEFAPITIETGELKYPFAKLKKETIENNESSLNHLEITIPMWEKIKEICEEAALEIPLVGYVEWDILVSEKKCFLKKGSSFPNHYLYQRIEHRESNIGDIPLMKEIEKRKIEK